MAFKALGLGISSAGESGKEIRSQKSGKKMSSQESSCPLLSSVVSPSLRFHFWKMGLGQGCLDTILFVPSLPTSACSSPHHLLLPQVTGTDSLVASFHTAASEHSDCHLLTPTSYSSKGAPSWCLTSYYVPLPTPLQSQWTPGFLQNSMSVSLWDIYSCYFPIISQLANICFSLRPQLKCH